jgi:tetratricopeptide (TPR) repeat protein
MRWLNWIKDHDWQWLKEIPKYFKNTITAPLSFFSKRSSKGSSIAGDDNVQDMDSSDVPLINSEELAGELASHLPDQQSSAEKNAEILELKNTIERLQLHSSNESKKAAIQELSEGDITKAAELLKKSALYRTTQTGQPAKEAALDWIDIGNITFLINPHKALTAFRKAVKLDPLNIDAWQRLGRISYWSANLNEAQKAYEQILTLAGEDKLLQAIGYVNLGTIYKNSGKLDKAEESYMKSLEINETLGRQQDVAFANGNLGIIHYMREEYDKAEEFYLESLEINEALDRQEDMAIQYCNLGIIYKKRGELNRAEEFYLKSLKINKSLGQKKGMASDYGNLGNVYKIRGKLNQACDYWKKSLELFSDINAKEQISQTEKLIADNCKTDN